MIITESLKYNSRTLFMHSKRNVIIKVLIAVTLLLQLINVAWAANHNCCPEDNTDCAMVNMAVGCTACIAAAIPAHEPTIFSEYRTLIKAIPNTPHYLSINNHVIWRPPIGSPLM
jgi:hypothetical protein